MDKIGTYIEAQFGNLLDFITWAAENHRGLTEG